MTLTFDPSTASLRLPKLYFGCAHPPHASRREYLMSAPRHVAVLMGGWSSEREVSLVSGEGVAKACEALGHRVTRIDMDRDVALRLLTAAATSGSLGVLLPFVAAATQWGDNLFGSNAAERLVPTSAGEARRRR